MYYRIFKIKLKEMHKNLEIVKLKIIKNDTNIYNYTRLVFMKKIILDNCISVDSCALF